MFVQTDQPNLLGSAYFTNEKGAYAQYTLKGLAAGYYEISFWNIKFPDTNPIKLEAEVCSGNLLQQHIPLPSNTSGPDRSGKWSVIGTYYLTGCGNEYVKLIANGGLYARIAEIKISKRGSSIPLQIIHPSDPNGKLSGQWYASFFGDSEGYHGFHQQQQLIQPGGTCLDKIPHNYYEIILVNQGSLCCTHHQGEIILGQNDIVLITPYEYHLCHNPDPKVPCVADCLFIHTPIFDSLVNDYHDLINVASMLNSVMTKATLPPPVAQSIRSRFGQLQQQSDPNSHKCLMLQALTCELISYFLIASDKEETRIPAWLDQSRRSMMGSPCNYIEGISKFVELSGKSQEHLNRSMKKYYHETPTQFINRLRIELAGNLLLSSKRSITEIIYYCGFTSISHFYAEFSQRYHTSPSKYRNRNSKWNMPTSAEK